jgi:hypothetical protein
VLVINDGLINQKWLKIQSTPLLKNNGIPVNLKNKFMGGFRVMSGMGGLNVVIYKILLIRQDQKTKCGNKNRALVVSKPLKPTIIYPRLFVSVF